MPASCNHNQSCVNCLAQAQSSSIVAVAIRLDLHKGAKGLGGVMRDPRLRSERALTRVRSVICGPDVSGPWKSYDTIILLWEPPKEIPDLGSP